MTYTLYIGGQFVPLDDDCADIDPDGASPPDDTYLVNALRSNALALLSYGPKVGWGQVGPHSDSLSLYTGLRPHASILPGSVLCVPWMVGDGDRLASMSSRLIYRAYDGQEVGLLSYSRLSLGVPGSEGFVSQEQTLTSAIGWSHAEQTLTCDLGAGVYPLMVSTRGDIGALILSSSPAEGIPRNRSRWRVLDASFYIKVTTSSPNASNRSLMVSRANYESGDVLYHDHIFIQGGDGGENDYTYASVYPQRDPGEANSLALCNIGYVQVKGIEVQSTYKTDDVINPLAYRAQTPVRGADDLQLSLYSQQKYKRPRPICVGPQGSEIPSALTEYYPPQYRYRGVYLEPGSGPYLILGDGGHLDTLAPVVRVLVYVLPYLTHRENYGSFEEQVKSATQTAWELSAEVVQWQSGALPTSLGASSTLVSLDHYPLNGDAVAGPALQSLYWRHSGIPGEKAQEGRIFDDDWPLIQTLSIDIPTSFDPTLHPEGVAVKVLASREGVVAWGDKIPSNARVEDNLVMQIIGYSIWEVPQ